MSSSKDLPHNIGDFIRDLRRNAKISLRQLAKLAGVSNPYLSQIERGLRKPSAEILQQIAKALRISAEALYIQAGILEQREGSRIVADAVQADEVLTERQKQVLLEIYESFRKENADAPSSATGSTTASPAGAAEPLATAPAPVKKKTPTTLTSKKAPAKRTATKTTASGGTA